MTKIERKMLADAAAKSRAAYNVKSGEYAEQFMAIMRESGDTPTGAALRLLHCAGIVAALTPLTAEDSTSVVLSGYQAAL